MYRLLSQLIKRLNSAIANPKNVRTVGGITTLLPLSRLPERTHLYVQSIKALRPTLKLFVFGIPEDSKGFQLQ